MKIGSEDKKKLLAMVGLFAIAVLLVLRALLSPGTPATTVAASATPNAANQFEAGGGSRGRGKVSLPLDPTLRTDLLKNSEEALYKGSGRNIFEEQAAPPIEQPKRAVVITPAPQLPAQPPPPPPIPLKFYGFANKPGQAKAIFLANGDDIFIGHEGEIVNRRYKILRIHATQVEIEDVLNNNRQTIPLTQG
jgi:hypothetical protein